VLFKGDGVLVNPVPIYAFLDFVESVLEQDQLERLKRMPRIPSISQDSLPDYIGREREIQITWNILAEEMGYKGKFAL